MLLDITPIKNETGSSLPFEVNLDLSDLELGGCRAETPIHAVGSVRNTAGVYVLSGTLNAELTGCCDRCARDVTKALTLPLHAVLGNPPENDDGDEDPWLFLLDGDKADLEEILRTSFVLGMEPQFLCKEDCKGLCPRCGKDLNDGPCDCKPEPDPRFAVLKQLLKDEK